MGNRSSRNQLLLFVRMARPLFLLGAVLVYGLGVGIAHYLGANIDWGVYLLGQAWVSSLQLATHFLNEYYDAPDDAANPNRTLFSGGSGTLGPDGLPRGTALVAGYSCLAVTASFTVLLIQSGRLGIAELLVMGLIFLGAFFYSVPPVRLAASGYGELTTSILVANLVPALALLLQFGSLHRLLPMSTFPLTSLHLAMMLTFELPDYTTDIKHQKRTLMVRLGWKSGMTLHNLLILSAYLLLALAASFGLPFWIFVPPLLTFPLGLLQIWQMRRISEGARPNWLALTVTPVVLFAVSTYLLAFAFWTR